MPTPAVDSVPKRSFERRADLPGVTRIRLTFEHQALSRSVPLRHATALHLEGESEWTAAGQPWTMRPGSVSVKVPGEVYIERARRGTSRLQVIVFDDALVDEARAALDRPRSERRAVSFDGARDPRARPLVALHRRLDGSALDDAGRDPSDLDGLLTDALTALVTLAELGPTRVERTTGHRTAVARARAVLDDRLTEHVSLDELARHARLDKFRLSRAFRDLVGLPPHAYVTHRRISLAQELLARGVPQAEVAVRVGLYDQSQLHRHFKRITGSTPGAYARAVR